MARHTVFCESESTLYLGIDPCTSKKGGRQIPKYLGYLSTVKISSLAGAGQGTIFGKEITSLEIEIDMASEI